MNADMHARQADRAGPAEWQVLSLVFESQRRTASVSQQCNCVQLSEATAIESCGADRGWTPAVALTE
jgi:hypothetical protein